MCAWRDIERVKNGRQFAAWLRTRYSTSNSPEEFARKLSVPSKVSSRLSIERSFVTIVFPLRSGRVRGCAVPAQSAVVFQSIMLSDQIRLQTLRQIEDL